MAKYEDIFRGDFDQFLNHLHDEILKGSASAGYEDGSDYRDGGVKCATRVYERYSMASSSRVSLSVTLIGKDGGLFISAITAGGSKALFFKLNTWGEETFLQCAVDAVKKYKKLYS